MGVTGDIMCHHPPVEIDLVTGRDSLAKDAPDSAGRLELAEGALDRPITQNAATGDAFDGGIAAVLFGPGVAELDEDPFDVAVADLQADGPVDFGLAHEAPHKRFPLLPSRHQGRGDIAGPSLKIPHVRRVCQGAVHGDQPLPATSA